MALAPSEPGTSLPRPFYFPVRAEPLRMQAGLSRFGSDFGNGPADQLFFSQDETRAPWLVEKARLLELYPQQNDGVVAGEPEQRALDAARSWMLATLQREGSGLVAELPLDQLGRHLAEDFVILHCPPGAPDRTLFTHVFFPSGWRPEHILGRSFLEIHGRIPAFAQVARAAATLTETMATRGPYVRFVWTISADAELDHHPDHGARASFSRQTPRAFLRVERQITVPLAPAAASLFLIRTYLYDFDDLSDEQRSLLARALELMPLEILRYKQLEQALPRALELLRRD
ncbi:MAG TPA: heme-dependent oxidative N-demethylase subunit alpha family protein [Polyangiaceae bacterium]|nr:heme-dependent oxidative N-demethylase subunit alpha family protein [Polyangiaceae bacterium]